MVSRRENIEDNTFRGWPDEWLPESATLADFPDSARKFISDEAFRLVGAAERTTPSYDPSTGDIIFSSKETPGTVVDIARVAGLSRPDTVFFEANANDPHFQVSKADWQLLDR